TVNVSGDATKGTTTITGSDGVDIRAWHAYPDIHPYSHAIAVALIPPQKATDDAVTSLSANVSTDRAVHVTAGSRDSSTPLVPSGSVNGMSAVALFVEAHNPIPKDDNNPNGDNGKITWNADVTVLGGQGGRPELVIDNTGKVVKQNNVSYTI